MTAADRTAGPAAPHPDLDTLADFDAGVLTDAETGAVRAHVSRCPRCGQVLATLGAVRTDLSALPAPPLPPAVAARLDATLADLRTGRPVGHSGQPTPAAGPVGRPADLRTDGRPDRRGDGPVDRRGDGPRDGRADGPGDRPRPVGDLGAARAARERRGQRWRVLGGTAAAGIALVVAGASITSLVRAGSGSDDSAGGGAGTALEQPSTTQREQDSAAGAPGATPPAPSLPLPDFDRTSLAAALPSLTTAYSVGRIADAGTGGPAGALADPAQRTACVRAIPDAEGEVTAVRWIRYAGRPAYVLVFEDGGTRTAYVVGDQCGRVPAVPATVLDTVR